MATARFKPEQCYGWADLREGDEVPAIRLSVASGCNLLVACTEPCKYLSHCGSGERLPSSSSVRFLLIEKPGVRHLTDQAGRPGSHYAMRARGSCYRAARKLLGNSKSRLGDQGVPGVLTLCRHCDVGAARSFAAAILSGDAGHRCH